MALPFATIADDLGLLRALAGVYPENIRTDASAVFRSEVTRIFMNIVRTDALPAEDVQCVGQFVAQRTGLTQSKRQGSA